MRRSQGECGGCISSGVPRDCGSPVRPAQQRQVVRHRDEDERLCGLDDLMDCVQVFGAIFSTEELRRRLRERTY